MKRILAMVASGLVVVLLLGVGALAAGLDAPPPIASTPAVASPAVVLPEGPVDAEQAAVAATVYRGGGLVRLVAAERNHGALVYAVRFADGGTVYVAAATGRVVYAHLGGLEGP
jgi:hypothetical protein